VVVVRLHTALTHESAVQSLVCDSEVYHVRIVMFSPHEVNNRIATVVHQGMHSDVVFYESVVDDRGTEGSVCLLKSATLTVGV
jgi:hypothetical protein